MTLWYSLMPVLLGHQSSAVGVNKQTEKKTFVEQTCTMQGGMVTCSTIFQEAGQAGPPVLSLICFVQCSHSHEGAAMEQEEHKNHFARPFGKTVSPPPPLSRFFVVQIHTLQCIKSLPTFLTPARMTLTKLSLGGNNV